MTTAPESHATTLPESIPLAEAQLPTPAAEAPVSTPRAEAPTSPPPAETPLWREGLTIARYYLGNRWVLLALGGGVLAMAATLNWGWLVAVGIAPILIAAAPCAVMCALGLCAMKMTGGSK